MSANEYHLIPNKFCIFDLTTNKRKKEEIMNQLLKLLSKFNFMVFGRFEFEIKQHNITVTHPINNEEVEVKKIEWVTNRQEFGDEPYCITIWGVKKGTSFDVTTYFTYNHLSDEDKEKVRSAIFLEMLDTDNSNL